MDSDTFDIVADIAVYILPDEEDDDQQKRNKKIKDKKKPISKDKKIKT